MIDFDKTWCVTEINWMGGRERAPNDGRVDMFKC